MMQRTLLCAAAFLTLTTVMVQAQAVPSPAASNCLACHGAGDTKSSFPDLSSLDAAAIAAAMAQFRSDARRGTIMNRIAKGYSDEESRLLAQELADAVHTGAKP